MNTALTNKYYIEQASRHKDDWKTALADETIRSQNILLVGTLFIFPLFAFFDLYTLPSNAYWPLTITRLIITLSIGAGVYLQKKYQSDPIYLNYFAILSISLFCTYATVIGGKENLYQRNMANCAVFIAASLYFIWHWRNALIVVLINILGYYVCIRYFSNVTLYDVLLSGGSVLLSVMVLFPMIVAYRHESLKREFFLKKELEDSNEALKKEKLESEHKNNELASAKNSLDYANSELQQMNSRLEEQVKVRTKDLELTNQELKKILTELDMFLYSSYHDLKGPIARLHGLVNLAKKEVNEDIAHFYMDKFADNINEMQLLMNKLNKINNLNTQAPEISKIDFGSLLYDVLAKYQLQIGVFQFTAEVKDKVPFYSDPAFIKFALEQLFENSFVYRKNREDDQIKISISTTEDNVRISVYDNGVGIPEGIIDNIFKMFYRGNVHSKGHGLGLYMAQKACEKLKGTIRAVSVENIFTEFVILIPNKVPQPKAVAYLSQKS